MAGRGPTGSASEHAERSIARLFVAARAAQLSFSTLMVIGDRRRFSRPRVQFVVLGLAVAESAWLARRLLAAGRFRDRRGMWVDTFSSAAGLAASAAGLGTGDVAPWMKNVAIGSALGASSSEIPAERAAAVGLLAGVALATGIRARGRDRHVAGFGLALNDVISWTGMHIACSLYVAAHRRYARLQDEAAAVTLEQAQEAAAEVERSHQHRLVHQATIEVLNELAASSDAAAAGALARQEAGRLRHVLRTKGQIPTGLDSALYEVSEAVRGRGLNVELVTADLGGEIADRFVAPLREAVHITLLAAHEFVGAERAVVRAVSDDGDVSVTVRHHVGGFVPGTDSLYERRLAALGPLLAPISGRVETWSEAHSGVRVTFTVSDVAETVARPSLTAEPGRSVERMAPVPPKDAGVSVEADSTAGWFDPARPLGRGVIPDERAEADRTVFTLFMAWRWSGLATGVAALIAGRRRYRSPAAAVTQLGMAVAESAWLARSIRRDGYRFGSRGRLVDGATAVALLVAGRANLVDEDLWTWINWTPWSFAANAVAGQAVGDGRFRANAATAAVISVAGATLAARSTDRVVNGVGMASCFAVGQVFVRQIRNGARRLEVARAAAVEEGRVLASERERSRQLRLLHDGALQTLETVGSGRYADLTGVQALAREEAQRLNDELAGTMAPEVTLVEAISSLVREHGRFGLDIDLSVDGATEPPPRVRRALQEAANEALTNVRKHAGTSLTQVSITRAGGGVQVAIHDEGAGFDPTQRAGFGTVESIVRRMAEVGGRAEIESAIGKGTRVTLWGPT
jgi:signal transduction histidine kinase